MKLSELSVITPAKVEALRERINRLGIDLARVEESFSRGGGKGGQKINKTSNAVVLRYEPLAIVVRCQRERQRSVNRFIALRELVDQVELRVSPESTGRRREQERIRKQKDRRRRRSG